jgi:hypothetical protein
MNNLEKEFVPYAEALALKELGFDEPCLGFYVKTQPKLNIGFIKNDRIYNENSNGNSLVGYGKSLIYASTFSQAFRWFREKHGIHSLIDGAHPWFRYAINSRDNEWEGFKELDFEKCQLACIRKQIEIVKENKR